MPKLTHTPDRIAARRTQVAHLLLARTTQQDIAARLKVSQATVSADIAAIRAGWTEEAQADLRELVAQECRILDADETLWRKQMQDALTTDLSLAVRIYHRVVGPIVERRARLRGMLPAPPEPNADTLTLDAILDRMGLGPVEDAADPGAASGWQVTGPTPPPD